MPPRGSWACATRRCRCRSSPCRPACARASRRPWTPWPDRRAERVQGPAFRQNAAHPRTIPMSLTPTWTGLVEHLHITARAFLPMRAQDSIALVAGRGIEGDRYMLGIEQGFYSEKPEEGRQVTLFEAEVLEAIQRDYGVELLPEEHRRNVTTRGVPLNWLVGRRFRIG